MNHLLKEFLKNEVAPMMKGLGYRKSGEYFYRIEKHFTFTIHFFRPPMTGRANEFIINIGIFSSAIGEFHGYRRDRKDAADMHHSHYIEHQHNITRHKNRERFEIIEDDIFSLGITVREILVEIDRFFQSVKDEDAFLEHLLENGCGLGSFFPDMVVKYALLTQRWEYAEELIKREQGRRDEWTYSPLLMEKYKELCHEDSGHRAFDVSWDKKLLGNRAAPQGLKILNENLEGRLEYEDFSWDFMRAYYAHPGMVAAVSGKVRKILEDLNVLKDEYTLKPVRILGREEQYYLLFLHQIPHTEIDFSKSLYKGNEKTYRKFSSYSEYMEKTNFAIIGFPVLPKKYKKRDLICIQDCAIHYMSARLIKAFQESGVKGIEFSPTSNLMFV